MDGEAQNSRTTDRQRDAVGAEQAAAAVQAAVRAAVVLAARAREQRGAAARAVLARARPAAQRARAPRGAPRRDDALAPLRADGGGVPPLAAPGRAQPVGAQAGVRRGALAAHAQRARVARALAAHLLVCDGIDIVQPEDRCLSKSQSMKCRSASIEISDVGSF